MKRSISITIGTFVAAAVIAAGITYWLKDLEVSSLQENNQRSEIAVSSLKSEVAALEKASTAYQQIALHQAQLAHSRGVAVGESIGNKLMVTQTALQELPKTIPQAKIQGYVPLDKINSDGTVSDSACFSHEGIAHFAREHPTTTAGTHWHGAPILLLYDISSERLVGMVLESTTPQPAPPWEYHPAGHPGMDFPHWSMHIWYTEPPTIS